MKKNHSKTFTTLLIFTSSLLSFAQNGNLLLKQDPKIDSLINKKVELDHKRYSSEYYTIQLYNGELSQAEIMLEKSKEKFPNIPVVLSFETPNYKVQAGQFKNKIKSLKTLDTIKQTFPSAFVLVKKNEY
ncbi:MAG: SPOR domain-containing protein [Flavobacteriaceae bacterium]